MNLSKGGSSVGGAGWLRSDLATDLSHLLAQTRLADWNTGLPRLVHTHQSHRSACQRQVLHEHDHVVHARIGILIAPEIVHHRRNSGQKTEEGHGPQLWFDAEQQTGPP